MPLIGKLIEKAHVEPPQVKNNAWQYFLRVFLKRLLPNQIFLVHARSLMMSQKIAIFHEL